VNAHKVRAPDDKATWHMDAADLARVFAEHYDYTLRGNWISDPEGRAVACGWASFAELLIARRWIVVGTGLNWHLIGERPRLPRAAGRNRR
jgi:hypothetical protein